MDFKTTKDIKVSDKIVDQIIGQEEAVEIIKKASKQRRHVFLIGDPGTGKSMIGQALAELLPKEKLVDILSLPNPADDNVPLIKTVPRGHGKELVWKLNMQAMSSFKNQTWLMFGLVLFVSLLPYYFWKTKQISDVIYAASMITGIVFIIGFMLFVNLGRRASIIGGERKQVQVPKLIIDNSGKDKAPFIDGTGAHDGALLGDVLHDPLQCFKPSQMVTIPGYNKLNDVKLDEEVNKRFIKYGDSLIKKESNNYEAVCFPKNNIFLLGEVNGFVLPVEVLSSNRHDYKGKVVKLVTSENCELVVTPEHKVAVWKGENIDYVEAEKIKEGDEIVTKSDVIIDEQDIINTYDKKQQEQCRLYYAYKELKSKNPSWGYKRIAKALGQSDGKTRWWHAGKHTPVPIQTVDWLKKKGLLPFKVDNIKLPLLAKVLGATFGDGGVFENLNGVFLSSSELESVKEFGRDLAEVFGEDVDKNSRIIEGGIEGHSWCYQNTNRNVIRFLKALDAPIGNKVNMNLNVPAWVYLLEVLKDEFFGSFIGREFGSPKVHKQKNRLDTLDISIGGKPNFIDNRLRFLNQLKDYLESKGIESTSIYKSELKTGKTIIFRLLVSVKFDNVVRFLKYTKINYCKYKKEKLVNSIEEFGSLKKKKYHELIERGYGAEYTMKLLNLTPQSLYTILNDERIIL